MLQFWKALKKYDDMKTIDNVHVFPNKVQVDDTVLTQSIVLRISAHSTQTRGTKKTLQQALKKSWLEPNDVQSDHS